MVCSKLISVVNLWLSFSWENGSSWSTLRTRQWSSFKSIMLGKYSWLFVVVCEQTWRCFVLFFLQTVCSLTVIATIPQSTNWQELTLLPSFWFLINSPAIKRLQRIQNPVYMQLVQMDVPVSYQVAISQRYEYLCILFFQSKHAACYWIGCSSHGLWFVSSTIFSWR